MKKVIKLSESELTRMIKRVVRESKGRINEDRERFELSIIQSKEGAKGTWRVEGGALILDDGSDLEMQVVEG